MEFEKIGEKLSSTPHHLSGIQQNVQDPKALRKSSINEQYSCVKVTGIFNVYSSVAPSKPGKNMGLDDKPILILPVLTSFTCCQGLAKLRTAKQPNQELPVPLGSLLMVSLKGIADMLETKQFQ
ncbi:hypothetical protein BTVI_47167 [Pitangus sulphuratus]|nr:hypothetical protein BTVI_47167 [Pitangus sulphuratus]